MLDKCNKLDIHNFFFKQQFLKQKNQKQQFYLFIFLSFFLYKY